MEAIDNHTPADALIEAEEQQPAQSDDADKLLEALVWACDGGKARVSTTGKRMHIALYLLRPELFGGIKPATFAFRHGMSRQSLDDHMAKLRRQFPGVFPRFKTRTPGPG